MQRTHRTVVDVKTIAKNMADWIPVSARLSQSLFLLKIFIPSKDVAAKEVKVGLGLWQIQGDHQLVGVVWFKSDKISRQV